MVVRKREGLFQSEVAFVLGVSVLTLTKWRRDGIGPKWRNARRPIYSIGSVLELHAAHLTLKRMGLRHANSAALPTLAELTAQGIIEAPNV